MTSAASLALPLQLGCSKRTNEAQTTLIFGMMADAHADLILQIFLIGLWY